MRCFITGIIIFLALSYCNSAAIKLKTGTWGWEDTDVEQVIRHLEAFSKEPSVHKFEQLQSNLQSNAHVNCDICKTAVYVLRALVKKHKSEEEIVKGVTKLCTTLKIEDQRVCAGIADSFKEVIIRVLTGLVLSNDEVCGLLIGGDCGTPYNPLSNWTVTFPDVPKPPVHPPKSPKDGDPKLRVLQLADIHIDMKYQHGSNAECGEPLCCRKDDGVPVGVPAGKWGDYRNCDLPTYTVDHLFAHLAKNDKFDFIYWTGDLPGHDVWKQTREEQLYLLDYLKYQFEKYFPGTPIYSALGNHEGVPVNCFPQPFIKGNDSVQWLYERLAEDWSVWLPSGDVNDTITRGAYYSVQLSPGFRLISVNSNYCNNLNFWLYINATDPAGELQWLVDTLQEAENNKEKVHIIAHIPPGQEECLQSWSWNYYEIINRYESTIAGQFFGHTHHDSMSMFFDKASPDPSLRRPTAAAYVAPSVTTYVNLNPAYRVYTMDGYYIDSTFAVLDHETYIFDLLEANLPDFKPLWTKEYSAKEAYGMESLFPRDWNELWGRLESNDTLLQQYYKYYYHSHPPTPVCDDTCRKQLLCDFITGRTKDEQICMNIKVTNKERSQWLAENKLC